MADNYIEKRMETYTTQKNAMRSPTRKTRTLNQLFLYNRSHRGYDSKRKVTREELLRIVNVNPKLGSARNRQCLRFRLVLDDEANKVLPTIKLGGALPELHLPEKGKEPHAFIIVCATVPEDKWTYVDLGISAQSMLLKAVEMELNGICIGAFDKERLMSALGLKHAPLLVIAIGKGMEDIRLTVIGEADDHTYFRRNGVCYVPKVKLDDLIL